MTIGREYDRANWPHLIESRTNGVAVCSFTYDYNLAGQRTRVTTAPEPSHWHYTYDAVGQVTSGRKRWSDSNWVAGAQFNYSFDSIGNRLWTEAGGDAAGTGLRHAAYTNNLLNQITARDVPGAADVTGSAHPQVVVTVNGSTASRHSDYYHQVLTWNNATGAVWAAITNRAQCQGLSDTSTGHVLLPRTPETFTYDQDGNLLQDGLWTYTWDAENRLTRMVSRSDTPSESWQWLEFRYDWQGRRLSKTVSNWVTGHWSLITDHRFVYDGWNLIAVLTSDLTPLATFTWGTDASGTLQGAGGVGGLLSMTLHRGTNAGTYFYCYDGNWNVVALVNAATGEVAAQYDYGPFHELLRATGPVARENPFLAATKYYDWETGLYYYGYRYYSPSLRKWMSRDAIGERGGLNSYAFCLGSPLDNIDLNGDQPLTYVEIRSIVSSRPAMGRLVSDSSGTWRVENFDSSAISDELLTCLFWIESKFDPSANAGWPRNGYGLGQVTRAAAVEIDRYSKSATFYPRTRDTEIIRSLGAAVAEGFRDAPSGESLAHSSDPSDQAIASIMSLSIDLRRNGNDINKALAAYGPPAAKAAQYGDVILHCEACLKHAKYKDKNGVPKEQASESCPNCLEKADSERQRAYGK